MPSSAAFTRKIRENGFLPAAGTVALYIPPRGPGIRLDSGIETGSEVSVHYDPILAKLIVWDEDRAAARRRMARALRETVVLGVRTNIAFLSDVIEHEAFGAGETWTDFVDRHFAEGPAAPPVPLEALAMADLARSRGNGTTTRSSAAGPAAGDRSSPWVDLEGFRLGTPAESP